MENAAQTYAARVAVTYAPDGPWADVEQTLRSLPPDTVVLLLTGC
jgi:hypothetical protein